MVRDPEEAFFNMDPHANANSTVSADGSPAPVSNSATPEDAAKRPVKADRDDEFVSLKTEN